MTRWPVSKSRPTISAPLNASSSHSEKKPLPPPRYPQPYAASPVGPPPFLPTKPPAGPPASAVLHRAARCSSATASPLALSLAPNFDLPTLRCRSRRHRSRLYARAQHHQSQVRRRSPPRAWARPSYRASAPGSPRLACRRPVCRWHLCRRMACGASARRAHPAPRKLHIPSPQQLSRQRSRQRSR